MMLFVLGLMLGSCIGAISIGVVASGKGDFEGS